jgi:hypothetical protein
VFNLCLVVLSFFVLFSREPEHQLKKTLVAETNEKSAGPASKPPKSMDDLLFKSPLAPARSYHSPRRSYHSPRYGLPPSPGQSGDVPSPKYCAYLCDPLSPMPPTPQYIHVDDDDEENREQVESAICDTKNERSVHSIPSSASGKTPSAAGRSAAAGRRGQLDRVLQNLKRTAENSNKVHLAAGGDSTIHDAVSAETSRRRSRKEPAEQLTKAELKSSSCSLEADVGVTSRKELEPGGSIFDTEEDPLLVPDSSGRERTRVAPAGAEVDDVDLVQQVRLALQQQSLAESRPSSRSSAVSIPSTSVRQGRPLPAGGFKSSGSSKPYCVFSFIRYGTCLIKSYRWYDWVHTGTLQQCCGSMTF